MLCEGLSGARPSHEPRPASARSKTHRPARVRVPEAQPGTRLSRCEVGLLAAAYR